MKIEMKIKMRKLKTKDLLKKRGGQTIGSQKTSGCGDTVQK